MIIIPINDAARAESARAERTPPREQIHGGDLARAASLYGGEPADWLDLSTGVNPTPYPMKAPPVSLWARLPDEDLVDKAAEAARFAYGAGPDAVVTPAAGAQAIIQVAPLLCAAGPWFDGAHPRVAIVSPTYSEHERVFTRAGWRVDRIARPEDAQGCDAAVVVNPNNPDGRGFDRARLLMLKTRVNLLIVDESFADVCPERSLAEEAGREGLLVLRSFGKFYGLAGARLGFALSCAEVAERLREALGPWSVSAPALAIGAAALRDRDWADVTRARLARDSGRLDALAKGRGWRLVGGASLFRTYEVGDAEAAQAALAKRHVWTRRFDYAPSWLRLGLPGDAASWARLESAMERAR